MHCIISACGGVHIAIHLVPRAKRDRVDGKHGDAIKVSITAPPVDGKANAYLLNFLAVKLDVPRSSVALVRGETSRLKTVFVRGLPAAEVESRLLT